MNSLNSSPPPQPPESPYHLLLRAALLIPAWHYALGLCFICAALLYNILECHFFGEMITGFRGQPVTLTFDPSSQLYHRVVSKCKLLHGRYCSTPWLSSPHLQTAFVHYFGNPPFVDYTRQLFVASDGGTIALDWVGNSPCVVDLKSAIADDKSPIIIVIPGLGNAADSAYVKHLSFRMAKSSCRVVVSNHRGLGGAPVTSDRFYTAAWTDDIRAVIDHIHGKYPEAPLFAVGASVGANILVKYLGEDGSNVPLVGAAAICNPWDSLLCDRFLRRRLVQRLYSISLTASLKDYANLHADTLSRVSNWEGIKKARCAREFDDAATRILAKCKTVDAYYRQCSSANYVERVEVPLLCISSMDDPVCTSEAIPWDECRLNRNVILATTQHGGHLPFFEGSTATSIWWVKVVDEFLSTLISNPIKEQK
ncbi:embryogenesis-associated protein EMB8-like [Andrographis paniculata]|uniref:embryogenesis-associated protein EMB8-like n=1 Tax=Andrographis paniculata TaxID=175694 RepID=UPI0021E8D2EA|nr:embryogenesis-associated protein EMB8-like [Andrographis paniculata]